MKSNMGKQDKMIRQVVALIIVVLYFAKLISGTTAIVLGVIAIVFAATSLFSFCPLYTLLGINTNKNNK